MKRRNIARSNGEYQELQIDIINIFRVTYRKRCDFYKYSINIFIKLKYRVLCFVAREFYNYKKINYFC